MAKDLEKEKKQPEAPSKKEKAEAVKTELTNQIEELRTKIADESDEKAKNKLRKQRDELIARRDGIIITDEKVKVPMTAAAKRGIKACIAIVVICALLVCYVATGAAKHGFISSLGYPQKIFTGMVLTDADGEKHSIKVSTYNFYFATYYNSLQQSQSYLSQLSGSSSSDSDVDFDVAFSKQTHTDDDGKKQTWAEYAEEQVLDQIKSTYSYYYAAVKANDGKEPEIKDDQKKEIQETLDQYKESAKNYGYTLSAYLMAAMGDGVDADVFEKEVTIQYIAQNYQEDYQKELAAKGYDEKDYKAYLKEHRTDLVSVDVKFFECSNEDDAKAFVKALNADGSNFAELASKYSDSDYDKKVNKNDVETTYKNMTRQTFISLGSAIGTADEHEHSEDENEEEEHTYEGLDWLYSKKRKAGDIKNFSTSVVYVLKPVYLSEVHPVTVRHILIQAEKEAEKDKDEDSEDSEESSEPEKVNLSEASKAEAKAAKEKAEKVFKEYKAGKQTSEAFAALAAEYSSDGNASDGGIYENVVPNQMVSSFNAWIFDSSRKAGDVEIVETEFGYHIIYFESTSDLTAWEYAAQQALASEDATSAVDKFEEANKIKKAWPGSCYFEKDTDIDN